MNNEKGQRTRDKGTRMWCEIKLCELYGFVEKKLKINNEK
jgi:hypothetical protein